MSEKGRESTDTEQQQQYGYEDGDGDGDGYAQRLSKYEEALEVKSLRRIISAYLNYSDAAEEDVRRYERSFEKLPHSHKALLSQFPLKCQRLRRCISVNSYFIMNMLQAFDPPLDMSQDINVCENEHAHGHMDHFSGERNFGSGCSASTSGRTCLSETDQTNSGEHSYMTCKPLEQKNSNQEVPGVADTIKGSWSTSQKCREESKLDGSLDVKDINGQEAAGSISDANGHVNPSPYYWLDPSFQLRVPLADVDKVQW